MKLVQPVGFLLIHSVVAANRGASRSSRQQLFRHSAAFVSTSRNSSSRLFGKQRFSSAGHTGTYSSAVAVAVAMAPTADNHNKSVVEGMPEEADLDPTSAEVSVVRFPPESIRLDTYNGITLDLGNITSLANNDVHDVLVTDAATFESALKDALIIWNAEERKGIWIRVPTNLSHVIPACTNLGFDFQFAEKGQLVLTKWLPTDGESRLPNGPTHQVGIGGLIFHPVTGKMLVVQEKSGPAAVRNLWKMPTGLTDPGEDIADAAVRELKEETGLECVFDRIVCFRQSHGGLFNRSDMFFVCLLKLGPVHMAQLEQGKEVPLAPQEEEIKEAAWVEKEAYANQELWIDSPLYKEMNRAMFLAAENSISDTIADTADTSLLASTSKRVGGFVGKKLPVGFRPGTNTIYSNL